MRFASPMMFLAWLLVLAWFGLFAYESLKRRQKQAETMSPALIQRLSLHRSRRLRGVSALAIGAGLLLAVIALARPQFGLHSELRRARGMDLIFALDLSRSMEARDAAPSRLQRAQIELSALADQLPGDRIGLVGFSSVALPLCPLTVDHRMLKIQLGDASPQQLPRGGTSIGEAIQSAQSMLKAGRREGAGQGILVVTDGEDHDQNAIEAAKAAKAAGIKVHVIGVGSETGEPIPDKGPQNQNLGYVKDAAGQTVVSKLNASLLRQLAEAGGGQIALPGPEGGLNLAPVRDLLLSEKRAELEERRVRIYHERFQWFLLPATLLILLGVWLRPSRPKHLASLVTAALLSLASPLGAEAQLSRVDPDVQSGNQSLQSGDPEGALKAYQKAEEAHGREPELLFNQALAAAQKGDHEAAIRQFAQVEAASKKPKLRSQAAFARGNSLRSTQKLKDAVGAYRSALLDDPANLAARRNLELAQQMLKIQPESQQPSPDQDKNQDSKDQDKKQDSKDQDSKDQDESQQKDEDSGKDEQGEKKDDSEKKDKSGADKDEKQADKKDKSEADKDEKQADKSDKSEADPSKADPSDAATGEPKDDKAKDEAREQVEGMLDALERQEHKLQRKWKMKGLPKGPVEKNW